MFQSKVVLCKLVLFPEPFRHVIPLQLSLREGLGHCLCDGLISKPLCLAVHRLHGMHKGAVLSRPVYLRLLHHQLSSLLCHLSPEHEPLPCLQGGAQKGHIIPVELYGSRLIPQMHHSHLQMAESDHVCCFCEDPLHRSCGFRHKAFNRLRLSEGVIRPGIIVQQFLHIGYIQL
ncbi:unknown [Clostridium sp. CAG:149]|nr:unknown [Clostridium sp. CAG:149]